MATALLTVLGLVLLGAESGSGAGSKISTSISTDGSKIHLTCTLNVSDTEIIGHRWMKGDKVLKEDALPGLEMQYELDTEESGGQYLCVFLPEVVGKASVNVKGPPKVKAVKKSEHATEGEGVVLACKSESFPPITEWVWYKMGDTEHQVLTNNSQNKVFVVSTETRTELHLLNLNLETDPGQYVCNGSSTEGTDHAVIVLHVRSQLAALWPFLGIVAEVLVLVTIIFIYEKRRKPDEVLDDEDTGSAPLKSSGHHVNDKDKSVRQRNTS